MPRNRPDRRPRRRLWPFAARRNRRVRPATGEVRLDQNGKTGKTAREAAGSSRRLWIVLPFLLALAGAGFGAHRFVTRSSHFALRTLRISTPLKHVTAASLAARAGVALGANLFAVDLAEIARDVQQEPWIFSAHARRELPSTVVVDVVERAACVVALNALYLADAQGVLFKRANPDEAATLPVITGVDRDQYLSEPERVRSMVRDALTVSGAWKQRAGRPALGELHVDHLLGVTAYTATGAVGVRLGRVDETLAARLERFDAVWSALADAGEKARLIYLDNRARPDRVTVKLAQPAVKPVEAKKSET